MRRLAVIVLALLALGSRDFDKASSQYLENTNAVITASPATVCVWGRTHAPTDDFQTMFGVGQTGVDENFRSRLRMTGTKIECECDGAAGAGSADTTVVPSGNTWFHLCCVFATTTSRAAYLDGGNKATNTSSSSPAGLDTTWLAQLDDGSPNDRFDGDLAQYCIWDAALTDSEIATLGAGFSCLRVRRSNLIFYAPINGGQSPEPDIIGGLDLTLQGGTPAKSAEPPIHGAIVAP